MKQMYQKEGKGEYDRDNLRACEDVVVDGDKKAARSKRKLEDESALTTQDRDADAKIVELAARSSECYDKAAALAEEGNVAQGFEALEEGSRFQAKQVHSFVCFIISHDTHN
jgi:hypothetical protein